MEIRGEYLASKYHPEEACRLGIGRFFGEISNFFKFPIENPDKKNPKFFMFAGHDNTLAPLLVGLEVFSGKHPSMGSAIILELWKNKNNEHVFQILYYDNLDNSLKTLQLPSCQSSLCDVQKLFDRMEILTPKDYFTECAIK